MKKTLCAFVAALLMMAALAACKSDETGSSQAPSSDLPQGEENNVTVGSGTIDFDEDPYTIIVLYPVTSDAQPDLPLVQEAVNEITLREINAYVEFEAVSLFSMKNIHALKASGQEKMDLMMLMPGYSYLIDYANTNMIMPLDDLIAEWGPDILASVGDKLAVGQYNGLQYAIPQNSDSKANGYGFKLSLPLCEKYDIDPESINSLADLEEAFALIKASEPEITVVAPETAGSNIATVLMGYVDTLGSGAGMLQVQGDGSLSVVNTFETEAYYEACQKVREWYELGYISRDVNTAQDAGSTLMQAGKVFCTVAQSLNPAMGGNEQVPLKAIMFDDGMLQTTTSNQMQMWAVPLNCARPDKAVQFVNLMDGNAELANLLHYGIEGKNYELNEAGAVEYLDVASWKVSWYIFGDYNKLYRRADMMAAAGVATLEEYNALFDAWDARVIESPAYGFTFDTSPVATQISAYDAVVDEYQKAIGNGTVDPAQEIPTFNERLYAAGLQEIIDEKQVQLDAWVASKA